MAVSSELRSILDSLDEPRLLIRHDFTVAFANQAFVRRYGRSDFAGRLCHELLFHSSERCSACSEGCPLEWSSVSGRREEVLRRELTPGGVHYLELQCTPVMRVDGQTALFMETVRDRSGSRTLISGGVVARSASVKRLLARIARVASLELPVLLSGPVGCGKEEFARLIHEHSRRAAHSYLPLDCRSLTPTLLGQELFRASGSGLAGGTLYLNDIADLSATMQSVILQLLETGRYSVQDDGRSEKADIRLICGTRVPLGKLLDSGRLREELYYRLCPCALRVPSLDERREDIPELAERLLKEIRLTGRHVTLTDDAKMTLAARSWRGNLRELRAVLERAAIFCNGEILPEDLLDEEDRHVGVPVVEESREERVRREIQNWQGSRAELAERLGVSERTLYRMIRKYRVG